MSQRSEGKLPPSLEDVSALVDGELGGSAVARACAEWRDDASAREAWHTYQLIGDVLRSDDLASSATHDSAFLLALRARLADEPVVLAPEPAVAAPLQVLQPAVANGYSAPSGHPAQIAQAAWRGWRTPAAVMAGFAVVASVLVVTRVPSSNPADAGGSPVLARGERQSVPLATLTTAPGPGSDGASAVPVLGRQADTQVVLDGELVRDARLDDYLAAHKKFGGSSGPGVPSGFLRNATATTPGR